MVSKLPKPLRQIASLLKQAIKEWQDDDASRLAAALAYHTAFSLAPLLVIVFAIAGAFWGTEAVQGYFLGETEKLIGADGAELIRGMVANAGSGNNDLIAMVIGTATLLLGATGAFSHLRTALNAIWDVPKTRVPTGIGALARSRVLSFGILLTVGFLLLVSLIVSAGISAMDEFVRGLFPSVQFMLTIVNFVVSAGLITVLFALLYKWLPDANVEWPDVWIGAGMTAILFSIGKLLIGLYLGNSSIASTYGAAASFAIILVWIYYSAQIFFFGAELTQVYANRYGSHIGFSPLQAAAQVQPEPLPVPAEMPQWLHEKAQPTRQEALLTRSTRATTSTASDGRMENLDHELRTKAGLSMPASAGDQQRGHASRDPLALTGVGGVLVLVGLFIGYLFGQRQGAQWSEEYIDYFEEGT